MTTKTKIYLAAPFFNDNQRHLVSELEKFIEKNKPEGWSVYSPSRDAFVISPDSPEEEKEKAFDMNYEVIEDCGLMIAVVDDRDMGTVWEMGAAYALKVPVITVSAFNYGVNLMLAFSTIGHVNVPDSVYQEVVDNVNSDDIPPKEIDVYSLRVSILLSRLDETLSQYVEEIIIKDRELEIERDQWLVDFKKTFPSRAVE